MTAIQRKYGSFKVRVQTEDGPQTHFIKPLTQYQIGAGWRQVLPKACKYIINKDNDMDICKVKSNRSFFKINMAELPLHLFKRLRPVYKRGNLSHYEVTERCYTYLVQLSLVDKEIRELQQFLCNYDNGDYQKQEYLNYCRNLLQTIKNNNINGWIVFKSHYILN
jgi:hypothetical protein